MPRFFSLVNMLSLVTADNSEDALNLIQVRAARLAEPAQDASMLQIQDEGNATQVDDYPLGETQAEVKSEISAEDLADMSRLCRHDRDLNFSTSVVTNNNLAGLGPGEGEESIIYKGITESGDPPRNVDLIITEKSGNYTPNDVSKNGLRGSAEAGEFGIVNLHVNSRASLKFNFVDSLTGEPMTVDSFYFTIFDIDQGMAHESRERITVHGFDKYFLSNETELAVKETDDGAMFTSSLRGGLIDNPMGPRALNEVQSDRTVTVIFSPTNSFSVDIEENHFADNDQGRNLLFGGPSSLVCGHVHNCQDFDCPEGYHIRTMAEFLTCAGAKCKETDRDTCCYEES